MVDATVMILLEGATPEWYNPMGLAVKHQQGKSVLNHRTGSNPVLTTMKTVTNSQDKTSSKHRIRIQSGGGIGRTAMGYRPTEVTGSNPVLTTQNKKQTKLTKRLFY